MKEIYATEIKIVGFVSADDKEKAVEDVLRNAMLDVPLSSILNFGVSAKARVATPEEVSQFVIEPSLVNLESNDV